MPYLLWYDGVFVLCVTSSCAWLGFPVILLCGCLYLLSVCCLVTLGSPLVPILNLAKYDSTNCQVSDHLFIILKYGYSNQVVSLGFWNLIGTNKFCIFVNDNQSKILLHSSIVSKINQLLQLTKIKTVVWKVVNWLTFNWTGCCDKCKNMILIDYNSTK